MNKRIAIPKACVAGFIVLFCMALLMGCATEIKERVKQKEIEYNDAVKKAEEIDRENRYLAQIKNKHLIKLEILRQKSNEIKKDIAKLENTYSANETVKEDVRKLSIKIRQVINYAKSVEQLPIKHSPDYLILKRNLKKDRNLLEDTISFAEGFIKDAIAFEALKLFLPESAHATVDTVSNIKTFFDGVRTFGPYIW